MSPALQADLFGAPSAVPEGFEYRPDLVSAEEEAALLAELAALPFQPFDFHGYLANRQVVSFGHRYDYGRRALSAAAPIPAFLGALRDKVGAFAGRPAADFEQVLINLYRPGAGIGWHRDKPHFDLVVGVSLGAPCAFRFRRKTGDSWARMSMRIEPRSAYLLTGPARHVWEHSIPAQDEQRYSITFRTMATPERG
jgi:alkylated DNA repair dioxygenase AlkB